MNISDPKSREYLDGDGLLLKLDDAAFAAFVDALDNPPEPNQKMKDLLAGCTPHPRLHEGEAQNA